jgi:putative Ca2+/H+ antiporter (TMEM165/GDT1 family)
MFVLVTPALANPNAGVIVSAPSPAPAPTVVVVAPGSLPAGSTITLVPSVADSGAADPSGVSLRMPGFVEAFMSTWAMIIVSELGDKTFFIAAILAMSHPRKDVFLAASAALFVMTVLSVALGVALPTLLPKQYTHLASCALFVVFGVKLLHAVLTGDGEGAQEELKEVEEELSAAAAAEAGAAEGADADDGDATDLDLEMQALKPARVTAGAGSSAGDIEAGEALKKGLVPGLYSTIQLSMRRCVTPLMLQCFTMTFLAEWGDRSQISTIALAASKNPYGVTLGGCLGHALCTGLAVLGGKLLASRISERAVNSIGGCLFLIFAAWGFMMGPA